ncbi:M61 family metallopeptidase [Flavihumibacter solisilvae]|uniref:M61 family metallopeptidase n=1 Tax=Flavihumibacter solisilvae TaxID=1349421 RepID=UPI00068F1D01|nr:M61 family metallopeptidase [Flavihumibacter solisilvae]
MKKIVALVFGSLLVVAVTYAQYPALRFVVSMPEPSNNVYNIVFNCEGLKEDSLVFKMPVWTPGYYQVMNYPEQVSDFTAVNQKGEQLQWKKSSVNSWVVMAANATGITINYQVKATRNFVAGNYLDSTRGYISPAGLFMHPEGKINTPVVVRLEPRAGWNSVATGLETIPGKAYTYRAKDYDVLYDSPILIGNLESFPAFKVKGVPHEFMAYKAADFDRNQLMTDLQKIIVAASGIIGDIPYNRYVFIGIGPGGGGIEHLNSSSVAFTGKELNERAGRIRIYNFLAHEYFHHYNVKRIRPIELGPFDYDKGSRTRMLWLSEGLTVYYEYLVLRRAGLTTEDEMLQEFSKSIKNYETKPGRQHQTPADASWNTWEDGPFGRTADKLNKTISPYDKGPLLGMLLDFRIRHDTKNKKSLDDLMRLLYQKYYKKLNRGFTEDEFRKDAEKLAGTNLQDFFDYIYTLKPVDYTTYFGYAGLSVDTSTYSISRKTDPGQLPAAILRDWMK